MDLLLPAWLFVWCQATPLATWVNRSPWTMGVVVTFHTVAFVVLLAGVALIDLRLLGLIQRGQSVARVARRAAPFIAASLTVVMATGVALFMAQAVTYAHSFSFLFTMGLFAIAIATHATLVAKATDLEELTPVRHRKIAAYLSLICWLAVAVSERGVPGVP